MLKIKIDSFNTKTGKHENTMIKSLYDYSTWVTRAAARGYEFFDFGKSGVHVIDQSGKQSRWFCVQQTLA